MNIGSYLRYLNKIKMAVFIAILGGTVAGLLLPVVSAQVGGTTGTGAGSQLSATLCGIIAGIATVIGVLAIFMFVLGGILYAFAHFLPAAGNLKGSMQGWGMGVLMGGIIMIILYVLAPFIVGTVLGFGITGNQFASLPSAGTVNCNGGILGGGGI
jgi:hypothetical protein